MRNHRREFVAALCVVIAMMCVAIAGGSSALAAWEELPSPPIVLKLGSIWYVDEEWQFPADLFSLIFQNLGCWPFMVFGGEDTIYIGYAPDSMIYDRWIEFNVISGTYVQRASPGAVFGNVNNCWLFGPSGAFVDGKVYVNTESNLQIAEYDVAGDSWSWAPISFENRSTFPSFSGDSEYLYWYDPSAGLNRWNTADDPLEKESVDLPSRREHASELNVLENRAYVAGGIYIEEVFKKGPIYPRPVVKTSKWSMIYDFENHELVDMNSVPNYAMMIGSGWGSDGLHFVGMDIDGVSTPDDGYPWTLVLLMYYSVRTDRIFHFVYNPEFDQWGTINDLPADCLPLSVSEQGGWLYGLFSCRTPNPHFPRMFRTRIDNLTWPPPTTTSTTTTTTTTSTTQPSDDDTTDDDTADDDALDDDSVGDDDTTLPNADASADGDDDDDGCGC